MNKLLSLTAITATVGAILLAGSGGAQMQIGKTLTLFQDTASETDSFVDNAPTSPAKNPGDPRFRLSTGDGLISLTPLLDRRGGKHVGTLYSHVAVVRGTTFEQATLEGQVILSLGDGQIVLAGLAGSAHRPFAVIGGTGRYEGAKGSATERETQNGALLTIHLLS